MEPLDNALDELFLKDEAEDTPVLRKKVSNGDVFEAARAGDVRRLQYWRDRKRVDVNARDCWDSVPLYYTSLAGHVDATLCLVGNGTHTAFCRKHTPDGDRCFSVARNPDVIMLLEASEPARPRQLQPVPAALCQALLRAGVNSAYCDARDVPAIDPAAALCSASDMVFHVSGKSISVHRALVAARSPFFCHMVAKEWKDSKNIYFSSRNCSHSALFSLLQFFYTDRLDMGVDEMEVMISICRNFKCHALQAHLETALADPGLDDHWMYKLEGSDLPEEHQLPAAMRNLFLLTLANSGTQQPRARQLQEKQQLGTTSSFNTPLPHAQLEEDHADVCFLVDGRMFRGHKFILAARSEYFKTRFCRAAEAEKASGTTKELPVMAEHDISSSAFQSLLEFVYTDALEKVDLSQAEEIFDAASRYLMFSLKRVVADTLLEELVFASPVQVCSWLLMAYKYEMRKLKEHCLNAMALTFKVNALFCSDFRATIASFPPPSGDSCLRTSVPAAPGEAGKGRENILDDLRETWLAMNGKELDKRDARAVEFDRMLEQARHNHFALVLEQ